MQFDISTAKMYKHKKHCFDIRTSKPVGKRKSKKWVFEVERNEDGLLNRVIATETNTGDK